MEDCIVLDTETTGLSTKSDRIIEIGAVRIRNRQVTDEYFHYYLKPDCQVHPAALAVHGITDDFLKDKPEFESIAESFIDFITGSTVIIHNAPFDTGFVNMELGRLGMFDMSHYIHDVVDTLVMARSRYRGRKNDLNSLLARYGIENNERALHGALLDAKLLATLYIRMTQKQEEIVFELSHGESKDSDLGSLLLADEQSVSVNPLWLTENDSVDSK